MKYKRTVNETVAGIKATNVLELEGSTEEVVELLSFLDYLDRPEDYSKESNQSEIIKH